MKDGVIEIGNVYWGPALSRTPVATEALYLFARHVFEELGYRRNAAAYLDLAHALSDPALEFDAFEEMVREAAHRDPRVTVTGRVDSDLMARSPVLVWRNVTRIKLIHARHIRAHHRRRQHEP